MKTHALQYFKLLMASCFVIACQQDGNDSARHFPQEPNKQLNQCISALVYKSCQSQKINQKLVVSITAQAIQQCPIEDMEDLLASTIESYCVRD